MNAGQHRQHGGAEPCRLLGLRFAEAAGGQLVVAPQVGQLHFVFAPQGGFLQQGQHRVRVAPGHGDDDGQKAIPQPPWPKRFRFRRRSRSIRRFRFPGLFAFPARIVRLGRVRRDHPAAAALVRAMDAFLLQKPLHVAHGNAPALRRGPDGNKFHRPSPFPERTVFSLLFLLYSDAAADASSHARPGVSE